MSYTPFYLEDYSMKVKLNEKGQAVPTGVVKMCAAYPDALLIPIHWGSVDAPDFSTFNGNPMELAARIVNPERLHVLLPGEKFEM